jgi:2-keto-3-deoxy-L-rhamnonate aldolase RhmA
MGSRLEQRLAEDRPAFGVWVTLRSPDLTELIAISGVDWIVLDLEHTDLGYSDLSDHIRAARRSDLTVLVRIPELRRDSIQRALDLGADGVMVPMASDAESVAMAQRCALYPPDGARGVSPARANDWGGYTGLADHLAKANDRIFVIPMFETRAGAENMDEMLSLPGLRAAFIGLADLSASFGDVGGFGANAEVTEVVDRVLAISAERGVAVGAMATSPEDAKLKAEAGYRMLGVGSDMGMFSSQLGATVAAMTAAVGAGERR